MWCVCVCVWEGGGSVLLTDLSLSSSRFNIKGRGVCVRGWVGGESGNEARLFAIHI